MTKLITKANGVQSYAQVNNIDLESGLKYLKTVQETVSGFVHDTVPESNHPPRPDQLRTYFLAIIVELSELLQEMNWKPWKGVKDPDLFKVADEFADVLAFLGVIIIYIDRLGISPEQLAKAYGNKTTINIQRFLGNVPGYKTQYNTPHFTHGDGREEKNNE